MFCWLFGRVEISPQKPSYADPYALCVTDGEEYEWPSVGHPPDREGTQQVTIPKRESLVV